MDRDLVYLWARFITVGESVPVWEERGVAGLVETGKGWVNGFVGVRLVNGEDIRVWYKEWNRSGQGSWLGVAGGLAMRTGAISTAGVSDWSV